MFCEFCGTELGRDAKFCKECGKQVKEIVIVEEMDFYEETDIDEEDSESIKYNIYDYIVLIGAVVSGISFFLPFVSIRFWGYKDSMTLLEGTLEDYGTVSIFVFIGVYIFIIVFTLLNCWILEFIAGTLEIVFMIINIYDVKQYDSYISKEIGYYLFIIFSLAMFSSMILKKALEKK